MESDQPDIVAAACRGDQEAWECLYRDLYPRLRAYLGRKVGTGNSEDAVSETMARAVRGIEGYRPGPAGFDGWVFGIARRVAADHYRKSGRLARQDRAAAIMVNGSESIAEQPSDRVVQDADRDAIRLKFSELSKSDQEVLELRVVAGLSAEQVAAVLQKEPGAIRTAQSRALGRLRALVEVDGD